MILERYQVVVLVSRSDSIKVLDGILTAGVDSNGVILNSTLVNAPWVLFCSHLLQVEVNLLSDPLVVLVDPEIHPQLGVAVHVRRLDLSDQLIDQVRTSHLQIHQLGQNKELEELLLALETLVRLRHLRVVR